MDTLDLTFHPLTQKLWRDFEMLFGENGACGGCWCMHWKLRGKAFSENKGEGNRQMQKSVVDAKIIPGLLAYSDGYPIGWVAIEPRGQYPKLAHSRVLAPIDGQEVWSLTCLFVGKKHRRKGVSVALIQAAVEHAAKHGARIVEGYPIATKGDAPPVFIFTGTATAFKQAGFVEAARPSPTRPIYRYIVPSSAGVRE